MSERIRTPFGQRLKRARVGLLPLVVWIGASFLGVRLWLGGPSAPTFHGLARADETQVSAPFDGQLERVHVGLFETVAAGAPLATFDAEALEAGIETARAELAQLGAELRAQRATLEAEDLAARRAAADRLGQALSTVSLEFPAELRAFHADEARVELAILETRLAVTSSELEADRVELRLRRAESLNEQNIGPEADAQDLAQLLARERARTLGLRAIEADLVRELEEARARRRALEQGFERPETVPFAEPALDERLAGLRAALDVQEERLRELALRRARCVLRAPVAGQVALVSASEGQFVLAGAPLLVLSAPRASEVTLWVPESAPSVPAIGERLVVSRAFEARPRESAECAVRAVAPRLELMPERLWRDARIAEYGRALLLGQVAGLTLVPGERVRVDPLRD